MNHNNSYSATHSPEILNSDLSILLRLKLQDKIAFELLYDKYASALYGIIIGLVQDEQKAEQVLQQSFEEYWNKLRGENLYTERLFIWMLKIARNKCSNLLQSSQVESGNQYLN